MSQNKVLWFVTKDQKIIDTEIMKRELIKTDDGSSSIYLPDWDESYHSRHGAVQEAYHVFIENGLDLFQNNSKVNILEIGFGTGLNCFISFLESTKRNLELTYDGVEAFPLKAKEISQLNYVKILKAESNSNIFHLLHEIPWEKYSKISSNFKLVKRKQFFNEIDDKNKFDLIYFDAFGARVQPELWTEEIFKLMHNSLTDGGVLVTYSAKGSVRRAMIAVGFSIERLHGPPGKREMLRGTKH